MKDIKTLAQAREALASLESQVAEITSLRESAAKSVELEAKVTALTAELEECRLSNEAKLAELVAAGETLKLAFTEKETALTEATTKIADLEAKSQTAESRALEITGQLGGPQLPVDAEGSEDAVSLSDLGAAVQAASKAKDEKALAVAYNKFVAKRNELRARAPRK